MRFLAICFLIILFTSVSGFCADNTDAAEPEMVITEKKVLQKGELPEEISRFHEVLNTGKLRVIGESRDGLPRYYAVSRAKLDARRRIRTDLLDFPLMGFSGIQELESRNPEFAVLFTEYLERAEPCEGTHMNFSQGDKKGYFCMEIPFEDLRKEILDHEPVPDEQKVPPFNPEADPILSDYGCIIVDTGGYSFVPAILNRVLSNTGELVWMPGEDSTTPVYTFNVTDAVSSLIGAGCRKPFTAKVKEVQRYTDAVLTYTDALEISRILAENSDAPVYFVFNYRD
ncbi:hypothetical protein [Limisalsivibrio acetivorans]|uniref:hypothetical protein n=1 Tax=Limisalsivibrio acetivorans TaxID=1304888 RepID=UPI0003B3DD1B|nr:hypothetical protein [Limisalsivibrio acetivorans]